MCFFGACMTQTFLQVMDMTFFRTVFMTLANSSGKDERVIFRVVCMCE